MKEFKYFLVFLIFGASLISGRGQTIKYTNATLNTKPLKFARHYGDQIFVEKSVKSDAHGNFLFFFDSLASGIYYIVKPDSSSIELLFDSDYPGKIEIAESNSSLILTNSPAPTLAYWNYLAEIEKHTQELKSIRFNLRQHDTKNRERKKLLKRKDVIQEEKDSLLSELVFSYDGSLLGNYLKAFQRVTIPDFKEKLGSNTPDTLVWRMQMQYYKKHYLDNLMIEDDRLLATPIYTSMINMWLNDINLQTSSELSNAIDYLLNRASKSTICQQYLTNYLLVKYNDLKNNGIYELVYLHIIKEYYLKGLCPWVSNETINSLSVEYSQRKPLTLGMPAPEIKMKDINGDSIILLDIIAPYTILYFHNYDCSLCKRTTPELMKIFYRYDPSFVRILALCVGEKEKTCKKHTKQSGITQWINAAEQDQTQMIANTYQLSYTPTIFLLNENKEIIGKNLNTKQLNEILKEAYK
jgi:protein-disulfide isomerase